MTDTIPARIGFSIVICNYNYARFVGAAVTSGIEQRYPQDLFEIIVVDDGSTDDSLSVLSAFAGRPNVRVFSQVNQGQAAAFLRGVTEARHPYVCLLDADDLYAPDKLTRVAARIAQVGSGTLFLCHDLEILDTVAARTLPKTWFQGLGISSLWNDLGLGARAAKYVYPFAVPCGQVFDRESLLWVLQGLPLADFRILADSPIAHAAFLKAGRVFYLHETLGTYRIHDANTVGAIRDGIYRPRDSWAAVLPKQAAYLERFVAGMPGSALERAERLSYIIERERAARTVFGVDSVSSAAPKVTFVVSTAEFPEGLADTLRSLQRQSHLRTEIVVAGTPAKLGGWIRSETSSVQVLTSISEGLAGSLDEYVAGYALATGEYVVFVRAGDLLDPAFLERHLHMHRHVSLAMITCSDIRLVDAQQTLLHAGCFAGTGRWPRALERLAPLADAATAWRGSPLSASMLRRNHLLDALLSYLQTSRPSHAELVGGQLLQRYAQLVGGALFFNECLASHRIADPTDLLRFSAEGPQGMLSIDVSQRLELALTFCEIVCQEFAAFARVFPRSWFVEFGNWVAAEQPEEARTRIADIVRRHGLPAGTFAPARSAGQADAAAGTQP